MQQTHSFKAEMSSLMDLVTHSLYQNQEVFLRELISNASDACERLRYLAISNEDLLKGQGEPGIVISFDKDKKTITIADNGVGMEQQEVIDNLGQIASSGTRRFLEQMQDKKDEADKQAVSEQLIGKFGVGFYASFLVADKVDVYTRKAGLSADLGVHFSTDGRTEYSLADVIRPSAGTEIILHVKEDCLRYLDARFLVELAKKYSAHISFPLKLPATDDAVVAGADQESQIINPAPALWLRPSKDISQNEYKEFYRSVGQSFDDPLTWLHCSLEGSAEYKAVLYVPSFASPQLLQQDYQGRVKLYIRRVFVTLEHKLLPEWLRFMVGVVDAPNLSMNISREALQNDKSISMLRKSLTKKIVNHFVSLAEKDDKLWQDIHSKFAMLLKQGVIVEQDLQEKLMGLLRFASNRDSETETSLDDYIKRMGAQKTIYYLTAPDLHTAQKSPYLEDLNKRNIEVLLCVDPIDEWMLGQIDHYKEHKFVAVHKGEFSLDDQPDKATTSDEDNKLLARIRKVLDKQVNTVRISQRLKESPVCLISGENDLSLHTAEALKQHGHTVKPIQPDLEVNAEHPLIVKLGTIDDDKVFGEYVQVLYDVATLSAVGRVPQPIDSSQRIIDLLAKFA